MSEVPVPQPEEQAQQLPLSEVAANIPAETEVRKKLPTWQEYHDDQVKVQTEGAKPTVPYPFHLAG